MLATEPKAIWAALPEARTLDPNALVELYTLGYCVSGRTLLDRVRCAEPGTIYRFGRDGTQTEPLSRPERGRAPRRYRPASLNAALLSALERYRAITPRAISQR